MLRRRKDEAKNSKAGEKGKKGRGTRGGGAFTGDVDTRDFA